jgi:hypothetical protein
MNMKHNKMNDKILLNEKNKIIKTLDEVSKRLKTSFRHIQPSSYYLELNGRTLIIILESELYLTLAVYNEKFASNGRALSSSDGLIDFKNRLYFGSFELIPKAPQESSWPNTESHNEESKKMEGTSEELLNYWGDLLESVSKKTNSINAMLP